ncbi:hypothetical protein PEPNEM18_01577 [Aedoeadaptatus nemausensis]|uniref:Uncharacterized protein n=1 Tax=Aedoeadaptatus nemausensis TaxID=2582829 RepID=A0A6V6Y6Z3_9FIRM|nr:hypothetical protein [Peptoniphilus nemausensis]CAC9935580.1 hypothetical protein PEPNEM18_01577 [Peptoniphilus nemausensis]
MERSFIDTIWVDTKIFEDNTVGSIKNMGRINGLISAYKIWEEANDTILNCKGNEEKLNQGFLSLKRAFNVTSLELRKNLGIDNIKYESKQKKKDFLGDLEYFEIIKTLTLNKYLNIRNLIEHENHSPPSVEDCLSLSEYIWNYIRSTVNIFSQFIEIISFTSSSNNKILFEYTIEQKKKMYIPHLFVTAFVGSRYVSFVHKENLMKVEKIKLLNKFDLQKEIEFEKKANCIDSLEHIAFKGEILDQDIIARYIKVLTLPEYGGLDDTSIQSIFSKV